jgi:hypothetical protein
MRGAGRFCGVYQTADGGHRVVNGTGDRQCDDQARSSVCVGVQAACELSATPLNPPLRLADAYVGRANVTFGAVREVVASTTDRPLGGLGVANSRIDPSGHVAQRRHYIQGR